MTHARVTQVSAEAAALVSAAAVSAVGLVVHNFADLPGRTVLHPESLYPVLLTSALIAIWFTKFRQAVTSALIGWATLNLIGGGIISVLPLPILPFRPEQSIRHYRFHLLYVLTQVPLLIAAVQSLRRSQCPP